MTDEQVINELMQARRDIAALTEQIKAAFKRIDEQKELADSLHALALSVERQTVELAQQRREIEATRKDIEDIKSRPGKRWDLIVVGLINAGISFLISTLNK